ncbi:MAG TPA: hypothetical protein VFT87_01880 [Candidatus Saccharimonadales bacterium]|nr:hypothetical protein [Candidatus Saccharimonadales bacterium]
MKTPTIEKMLQGLPETILPPIKQNSVLITWQHTNEELAPRTMHHILTKRPDLAPHVGYICGNPLTAATQPEKGFTESDLNRSYKPVGEPKTYEEKRAVKVLELARRYSYVLDIHGAVGDTGDFLIVAEDKVDSPAAAKIIAASKNKWIVVMPRFIADSTLIGAANNAVVVEYFVGHVAQGVRDSEAIIEALVTDTIPHDPFEREFFFVTGTVPKTDDPGLDAKNFELVQDKHGGYYPIILGTGPRSYREDPTKDYCCFAARRCEVRVM